jgi:hypothetical protein
MSQGLSLTASAGAMGICRATIHRWIDAHPEFRDSVARAKAMRVFKLETELLSSENAAFINARRFALINAAPEEWREKQAVDVDVPADSPIRLLAQQLMGTAIRPQHPAGVIIDHDPTEMVTVTAPVERVNVTIAIPVTTNDERDEDDNAPRLHTI